MASLILVMGLPASGKTTYAKKGTGVHVNMDQIRQGATGSQQVQGNFNELVHHLTQRSVHFYLTQGKNVIVDAWFLKAAERKLYISMAKKLGATVEVHWLDTPLPIIKERLLLRQDERRLASLTKLASGLELPLYEEGMDVLHYINERDM